jgi:aminoglycoside phosphotransferase (APT) family kinase protein
MAEYNVFDEAEVRRGLERWLPERLGADRVRVSELQTPAMSGASALTFIFRCVWTESGREREDGFVARVVPADPANGGLFMDYDLEMEAALARAAGRVVPAPEIIAVEPQNTEVFGNPFLVTRFIPGRVVTDQPPLTSPESWVWKLSEEEQGKLADECLKAIAGVQSIDFVTEQIPGLRPPVQAPNKIAASIDYWERAYYWGKRPEDDKPHELWDATLAYLRANIPQDEPTVLNWGDGRVGNMIFDDNLDAIAVLDWEMACLGSPEIDLAYFLYHLRWTTEGFDLPQLPGFPTAAQTVERFEELTGHTVRHQYFYEMFGCLRMIALGSRYAYLLENAGIIAPEADFARTNPGCKVAHGYLERGPVTS